MVRLALSALLVGYLPGALVFRLPVADRDRRASLDAAERVFWHVILSVVWSLTLVLVLAVFEAYRFEWLLASNAALSVILLLGWRGRLRFAAGAATPPGWSVAAPLALIALGVALFFPPSEYVMGGKDPGTYVNEGIQIAQRGTLLFRDPVIAGMPKPLADLFIPSYRDPHYYSVRFMGFWVQDPQAGTVVGQFPHLFPASIAIGYGLHGLSGARQAVAVWAMLGLVAVYLVGARLVGRTAAFSAAALLAINVITVWFARYPNSEHVMQALLFAALLAFARAQAHGSRFFGPIAGALLGLMVFLRYDAVLAIAAFTAAWACLPIVRRRIGFGYALTLVVTSWVAFEYLAGLMRGYAAYPLAYTHDRGGWTLVGIAAVAALAFRVVGRRTAAAGFLRAWIPRVLAVAIVLLACYAYFLREAGGGTAVFDATALRVFGWYITTWGLFAAVIGVAVLAWRRFWIDPAFIMATMAYGVFFFYKTRITPEHFFAMRRFLAIALPAALIGIAGLAAWAATAAVRRVVRDRAASTGPQLVSGLLTLVLVAPLAAAFWAAAAPVRPHIEQAGLIPRLETLAAAFTDRDLVIVEARNASDTHVLALPLAYIYDRRVLVLANPRPDKRLMETFLDWAASRYDRVFFLGGGGTDLLSRRIAAEPVKSWQFTIPEYDTPMNAYPQGVLSKEFDFGLYRVTRTDTAPEAPVDLTIGTLDELDVIRFHSKERHGEGWTFRWTRDVSYVLLGHAGASARQVTIWMSDGGRPASAPPPEVEVAIEESVIGRVRLDAEIRPYVFDIPREVAAAMGASADPVRLRLRTSTWNPKTLLGAPDGRDLGVIVTRVAVQ